jgi:hypothetical protein
MQPLSAPTSSRAIKEGIENNPRLASFKTQFEALSSTARRSLTWAQVVNAMELSVDELLANVAKLEKAQVFRVDENNNLVFCDGGDEVPSSTLDKNYFVNRKETLEQGLELFPEDEYLLLQDGERKYDRKFVSWIEAGDAPFDGVFACWYSNENRLEISTDFPEDPEKWRGARRLLRVKLNLNQ